MKQRETLIRKIIPVELFDMAGLEHWLSDMAAQGLHLVKLNHDTARPAGALSGMCSSLCWRLF